MSSELDHSWVDEYSTEVDETAELLGDSFEVEDVSYGPEDLFESSETFGEDAGLMALAESPEYIVNKAGEITLGTVELEGPSQYPGITYELELVAGSEGVHWQFDLTDADTDLPAHNNYIRNIEQELAGYEIETVTEEYKPKSGFLEPQPMAAD